MKKLSNFDMQHLPEIVTVVELAIVTLSPDPGTPEGFQIIGLFQFPETIDIFDPANSDVGRIKASKNIPAINDCKFLYNLFRNSLLCVRINAFSMVSVY